MARGLLQPFKEKHPAVSYADLWALAAVVAISASGGPSIPFSAGRLDIASASECVAAGRLPDGDKGATHVRSIFYRMGFNDTDIVALSGAHTLGRCHADRSGFEGPWTEDPLEFDGEYYTTLLGCQWLEGFAVDTGKPQMYSPDCDGLMMLHTDVALLSDDAFRGHVEVFAADTDAWFAAFAKAFATLQEKGHAGLQLVF